MTTKLTTIAAVAAAALALQQLASHRRRQLREEERAKQQVAAADARAREAAVADGVEIEIEYCTGCRWLLRASWLAQELLTTFQTDADSRLRSVTLTPNSKRPGGVFQVYAHTGTGPNRETELLWSRKVAGRFPESKELKQLVRDVVSPDKSLGHSDKTSH